MKVSFTAFLLALCVGVQALADDVWVRTPTRPRRDRQYHQQVPSYPQQYPEVRQYPETRQQYPEARQQYPETRPQYPETRPYPEQRRPQYRDEQRDCGCCGCEQQGQNGIYSGRDPIEAFFADNRVQAELAQAEQRGYRVDQPSAAKIILFSECGVAGCTDSFMVSVALRGGQQTYSTAAVVTVFPAAVRQPATVRIVNVKNLIQPSYR